MKHLICREALTFLLFTGHLERIQWYKNKFYKVGFMRKCLLIKFCLIKCRRMKNYLNVGKNLNDVKKIKNNLLLVKLLTLIINK